MTDITEKLLKQISSYQNNVRIMEICGTHTHQIAKFGIRSLLPKNIKLLSGPGCPVCVTEAGYIDAAIKLLDDSKVMIVSFGDLIRVSGSNSSLAEQKTMGKNVVVIYSPEEVIKIALENTDKLVVFLAVGFETTVPLFATLICQADELNLNNLFFFTSLKRMEPILHHMLGTLSISIDVMICPGHVATITGIAPFLPITNIYGIPAVICGFEAEDILTGIHVLLKQIAGKKQRKLINLYKRCVKQDGNTIAKSVTDEVFVSSDVRWRGIGMIHDSAYVINTRYERFDAMKYFGITISSTCLSDGCECGEVLLGLKAPTMCQKFGKGCTPEHPIGPCMVSSEGTCAAYYKEIGSAR